VSVCCTPAASDFVDILVTSAAEVGADVCVVWWRRLSHAIPCCVFGAQLPGIIATAVLVDRVGRRRIQAIEFGIVSASFWVVVLTGSLSHALDRALLFIGRIHDLPCVCCNACALCPVPLPPPPPGTMGCCLPCACAWWMLFSWLLSVQDVPSSPAHLLSHW
jgi:hypothetical protein